MIKKALTIAGSDSGGGAGIQADLKTFQELGVFGMSAVTAVTAQNTLGVHGVYPLSAEAVAAQTSAIGEDLPPDAVKTGMLFNREIIIAVAEAIKKFGWTNLVIDPVMIAKGGSTLLQREAIQAMTEHLIPLAAVITPNIPEAEALTGLSIRSETDKKEACHLLHEMGAASVLIKGGHEEDAAYSSDLLFTGESYTVLKSKRVDTRHTHGTGCTFSSALTAELAKGKTVTEAAGTAKQFIQAAIEETLEFGGGHGPTNHWAYKRREREL
ncbi:bifunctional hydroxymethylpyrimidine kinase/phosphomethylpyrimidine kinase [Bacillus sp. FJAT-42376]|uniref:bifunctional hydroxymethylpyrimidine kinase/phosphomethylpyrimidine kinase n=1 Tax=Bacillus sp. FJAT-42376 TaxID=2014076 RepID=UPI000F510707|nr:bifunctional hydroxymethylpyrimidine kinase/phosphomethylpyrimidine kinase [Bacillus sp. FJAT-42376]AZB42487.1 bifunctional hydroxymethylpyrimidine kinase/phosphomethylpyrimidine kinase [Bacillus sp. FJAT-42376]